VFYVSIGRIPQKIKVAKVAPNLEREAVLKGPAMSAKKRVMVLHTGGTVGMDLSGGFLRNEQSFLEQLKKYAPRMFELAEIGFEILLNKDSSNMDPHDWVHIARKLNAIMNDWDAFVITHGTDTMAFTASALSFMIKNPQKPIILTGSQRPLSDAKSDAPRNLINAVELATEARVREVCIFFDSALMRGNRAKKVSIPAFKAFDSPNHPPLATVGISTDYSNSTLTDGPYAFDPRIETRILSLPLFPGVDTELFLGLVEKGVRGLVLQAFGTGNIPLAETSVLNLIRRLTERGIPTVICSQALFGSVDLDLYETGRAARDAGAISAGDMTWESVLVKMMVLLGRGLSIEPFRTQFSSSLAGEITAPAGTA
jgi:L-asparaginase